MDGYMFLAYILAGAGVLLIVFFCFLLFATALDIIRNGFKEVKEDDPFIETEIAE